MADSTLENLKEISLSQAEIKELYENKYLSPDLARVFRGSWKHEVNGLWYGDRNMPVFAKNAGAKLAIDLGITSPCLFFTDNFLVGVVKPNEIHGKNGISEYKDEIHELVVIPLSYIEKIEVEGDRLDGAYSNTSKKIENNAIKGAVIGGVLAGSTGAVIGAVAGGQPKEKVTTTVGSFDVTPVKVKIVLKRKQITGLYGIDMFEADNKGGKLRDAGKWTLVMNEELTGWQHDIESINDGTLIEQYNDWFKSQIENAIDFDIRYKIIEYLRAKYSVRLSVSKFCSEDSLIEGISEEIGKDCLPERITAVIDKYDGFLETKGELEDSIQKKEKALSSLGFFKKEEKRALENEINELKVKLRDTGDCKIYSVLKDEYWTAITAEEAERKNDRIGDAKAVVLEQAKELFGINSPNGKRFNHAVLRNKSPKLQVYTEDEVLSTLRLLHKEGILEKSKAPNGNILWEVKGQVSADSSASDQNSKPQSDTGNSISGADEILKYKNLMDQGIITPEEFEAKKKQILGI